MRYAALAVAALIGLWAMPALADETITVHPGPQGNGTDIQFPTLNNPNYLDYGPLPDKPGSDKSQDYEDQAGGNDPIGSGPGSDNDSDVLPDSDGAYDE